MAVKKERKPLFERLKGSLEEGIDHASGKIPLKTKKYPSAPPQVEPHTLVAIRRQAQLSQSLFARVLSVSTKTLQSWEQGNRIPSDSNLRLIQLFTEHPQVFCRSVGIPECDLHGFEVREIRGVTKIVAATAKVTSNP